jgi:hypothetical protein
MLCEWRLVGGFLGMLPFFVACSDADDASPPASEWSGKTYLVELQNKHWDEPRGQIVLEFAPYVRGFLLAVNGPSSAYDVTVATLNLILDDDNPPPLAQDTCNPTTTLRGSGNAIGVGEIPLNIRHRNEDVSVHAVARNFSINSALPTGGVISETGDFSGTLDAREIAPLFLIIADNPTPEMLCTELAEYEPPAPCQPCPQDGEPWCLTLKARRFGATETTLPIQPISDADSRAVGCEGGLSN